MIQGVFKADQYVYHYTKADTALEYILKSGTLLLAPYDRTNDPKETKAWDFSAWTGENRDLSSYGQANTSAWLSHQLKSRARVACFTKDRAPLTGEHMGDIFNRGYTKPRMWAQYAQNHTGVCLVFSKDALVSTLHQHFGSNWLMTGHVKYRNHDIADRNFAAEFTLNVDMYEALGPTAYVRSHIQAHHRSLFFEKLVDWRDEDEWRILAFANSSDQLLLPIKTSLVGVMHGDATDPDVSEAVIRSTFGWNGVQHMGLSWRNSTPWYDYSSFSWQPGKVGRPRRKAPSGA